MNFIKTSLIILLSVSTLSLFSGCKSTPTRIKSPYAATYERANQNKHILGIIKSEKSSYEPASPTSIVLRTNDISTRNNISGDKVTLFWDLITLTDY